MTRPLSAEELNAIAGKRLTAEERRAWRTAAERTPLPKPNEDRGENPYKFVLKSLNPTSRDPRERNRYQRFKSLADARDLELAQEREQETTRLKMSEDSDVRKAKSHYAEIVENFPSSDPADIRDKSACFEALSQALNGAKKHGLDLYYEHARSLCDRKLSQHEEELNEARSEDAETRQQRVQMEAEQARMKAAALAPPYNQPPAERSESDA